MWNRAAHLCARVAVVMVVVVLLAGPVWLVARLAGNPLPAELWSRLGDRRIDDRSMLRLGSLAFYVLWVWFAVPALRQAMLSLGGARLGGRRPAGEPAEGRGPRAWLARLMRFALAPLAAASAVAPAALTVPALPMFDRTVSTPAAVTATADAAPTGQVAAPVDTVEVVAGRRDTPYSLAVRLDVDRVEDLRGEIVTLNMGRGTPSGGSWNGGGFPEGMSLLVPRVAAGGAGFLAAAELTVADGDNLWAMSQARLEVVDGDRSPTDVAVADYLRVVIDGNTFRSGDPNLIFPGERYLFPELGVPPDVDPSAAVPPPAPEVDAPAPPTPTLDVPAQAPTPDVSPAAAPTPDVSPAAAPTPDVSPAAAPTPDVPAAPGRVPAVPAEASTTPAVPAVEPVAGRGTSAGAAGGAVDAVARPPDPGDDPGEGLSLLPGLAGATVLASGVAATVVRLRRGRRSARRHAPTAQVAAGVEDVADVALVRWLSRQLGVLGCVIDPGEMHGEPVGVMLDADRRTAELVWTSPNPTAPAPWRPVDGGWSWEAAFDPATPLPVPELASPLPTLVAAGSVAGRQVLIDLEHAGSLAVSGEPAAVAGFVRSVAVELAVGDHLADVTVVLVGVDPPGAGLLDRVRTVGIDEAIEVLKRETDAWSPAVAAAGSVFRARLAGGRSLSHPATVVFACGVDAGDRERLVGAAPPAGGATVVFAGEVDTAGAHLHLDGGGGLLVGIGGQRLRLDPADVPQATAAAIDALLVETQATGPRRDAGTTVDERAVHPDEAADGGCDPTGMRMCLRVFGEVGVDGLDVAQALAVPFALAYAARPMSSAELGELTGYASKTFSTVFTSDHPLVHRVEGRLELAAGVWTDHGWIAECVRRAASDAGRVSAGGWLGEAWQAAGRITGRPFETVRGRNGRNPWAWVDDWPVDVCARDRATQQLVDSVLLAARLVADGGVDPRCTPEQIVEVLCRLAGLVPHAPVAVEVRPSDWQSAGECLLLAANRAAGDDARLVAEVHATVRRMVADGVIDASDEFADQLGL